MPRIQINYTSGLSMILECDDISGMEDGGKLLQLTVENPRPRAVHIGIENIESIWELET